MQRAFGGAVRQAGKTLMHDKSCATIKPNFRLKYLVHLRGHQNLAYFLGRRAASCGLTGTMMFDETEFANRRGSDIL